MTETRFKKSIAGTFATGIILEKELSTEEVYNELIKLEKENEQLKKQNNELKLILKKYALAEEKWGKGSAVLVLNEKVRRLIE